VSYTKSELVTASLGELGMADYEFDITPEEITSGVRRMDSMLSQWSLRGVRVPYNFVGGPGDDSGLPIAFHEAVTLNLAIRLAPSYGKQPSMSVMTVAKQAFDSILSRSALPPEIQFSSMPLGSGYKGTYRQFTHPIVNHGDVAGMDNFQNFSDDSTLIHKGDIGSLIQVSIAGMGDPLEITVATIHYRKPSGEKGQWEGTVKDDFIEYATIEGDIDEAGVWYLQAKFDLVDWNGSSRITSITVAESL